MSRMLPSESELHEVKRRNLHSWLLTTPGLLWLLFFFFVPFLIVFFYSFLTPTIYDIKFLFSLDAYRNVFRFIYLRPFLLAFRLAFITTVFCLLLGYPTAYYIARSNEKLKNFFLMLIIIPFWTNFIIRIFAWRIFLSNEGVLNEMLIGLGILHQPLIMLRTDFAVVLVMVYVYLPFMILPLYSTIEKIDFVLLQAAMDLGANEVQAFRKVTLPLTKEGIFAGSILVFIPALGAYIVPQLVGHQNSLYIGQVITYKIKNIPRDWPLASALSLVLLAIVSVMLIAAYAWQHQSRRRAMR
jgi:spermidine/putrescine transport system permease protein